MASPSLPLYFAYGSNLNQADFDRWCKDRNHPPCTLRFHSRAYLPDHELTFNVHSQRRSGGVLNLRPRPHQLVPGALFEIDAFAKSLLDEKESAPKWYKEAMLPVIQESGQVTSALTYIVPSDRTDDSITAAPEYASIVRQGLKARQLGMDHLEYAIRKKPAPLPSTFFFYGTLMQGQSRGPIVKRLGGQVIARATIPGRLVDLGAYPGLVDLGCSDSLVHGELVKFPRVAAAMEEFDAIEGFRGFDKTGSLYGRTWIAVEDESENRHHAWTYHYQRDWQNANIIPSGDWREYRPHSS